MTETREKKPEVLRLEGVSMRFGAVTAIESVDLQIRQGEVVALLGDNGAGKSTLIKIISGSLQPTGGRYFFDGVERRFSSPHDAKVLGIETVYQDLSICMNVDVVANFFMGREMVRRVLGIPILREAEMRTITEDVLKKAGTRIPSVRIDAEHLSGGQRQAIAVARAVNSNARILLLDEPLAAMGAREAGLIIDLILRLKAKGGLSIIMIMHNYAQTLDIADRVMLMQRGRVTYQREAASTSVEELMDIVRREYRAMRTMGR